MKIFPSFALLTLSFVSLSAAAKESAWSAGNDELCFRLSTAGVRARQVSIPQNVCLDRVAIQLNLRKGVGEVLVSGSSEIAGGHAYKTYGVYGNREAAVLHAEIFSQQEGSTCDRSEDVRLNLTLQLDANDEIVGQPKLSGSYSVTEDDCHLSSEETELSYERVQR